MGVVIKERKITTYKLDFDESNPLHGNKDRWDRISYAYRPVRLSNGNFVWLKDYLISQTYTNKRPFIKRKNLLMINRKKKIDKILSKIK
jgi:hypothetical protein